MYLFPLSGSTDPHVPSSGLVFKPNHDLVEYNIHPRAIELYSSWYADWSLKPKSLAASSHSFLLEIIESPFDAHVAEFMIANLAVYVKISNKIS